jgi:hypothetical protein
LQVLAVQDISLCRNHRIGIGAGFPWNWPTISWLQVAMLYYMPEHRHLGDYDKAGY